MPNDIMIKLVDNENRAIDYFPIGFMADYSSHRACPRISANSVIPVNLSVNPDPLGDPGPDIAQERNPFRKYPCVGCMKFERKANFNPGKDSKNTFMCTQFKGSVKELGYYDRGTSQPNLPSKSLE
jgi:hypothetical protein